MGPRRPLIIAHRGASVAHPENTVEAFVGAAVLGADAVELDARRTADGAVVVHHDDTLPDGRVIVTMARVELPASVPSLAEALDACDELIVNVEIKNWPDEADFDPSEAVADAVVDEVERRGVASRIVVSSFHRPTIDRVRSRSPELATAYLHALQDGPTALAEVVEHGHPLLHPWYGWVTEELIATAHDRGVGVNAWTVDDPEVMARLASWEVDGIVTNLPDLALEVLGPR